MQTQVTASQEMDAPNPHQSCNDSTPYTLLKVYPQQREVGGTSVAMPEPHPRSPTGTGDGPPPYFSSQGELIVYQSSRRPSVCVSVRPCVNTFKYEYFHNQRADHNQILTEASLGWVKGCNKFWARSDQNSGFHGNR